MPFKAPADDQTLLGKHVSQNVFLFGCTRNIFCGNSFGLQKTKRFYFFSEIFYFATLRDKSLTASSRVALDAIHELSMRKHSFQ